MPKGTPKTKERLQQRQLTFVDNLFRGMTQTAAYMEAYSITEKRGRKYDAARSDASRLVASANVGAEIERRRKLIDKRVVASAERIAEELACLAYADPIGSGLFKVIDGHFYVADSTVIPDSLRRAIAEIHETEHGLRVKFHSKEAALRMLGQWRKMFVEKLEIDISTKLAERLKRAAERIAQRNKEPAAPAEGGS